MARKIATLLLLFAFGSCMEMRETVERTVMVRTTGSDLQPAATGYIYKKESDGPVSVVKMGESEVIEHFSKMYGIPEAYKAPIPAAAGPFHDTKDDGEKAASHASEDHVKPVEEYTNEHDDRIDGIASEDYDKIFADYTKKYGSGYKDDFSDYLHGIGHFEHGIYHEYGGGNDHGSKGYHGYGDTGHEGYGKKHHYGKGDTGNYHSAKHEGYTVSKEGSHKNHYGDAHGHGKHFAHGHEHIHDDHGRKGDFSKGEEIDGFHKIFDKNEYKKDHDIYDAEGLKGDEHKYSDGHKGYGSAAGGHKKGGSHNSGHYEKGFEDAGFVAKESGDEHDAGHSSDKGGESHHYHDGKFGAKGEEYTGNGYGYQIKH